MPLNYNPGNYDESSSGGHTVPDPGNYSFKVDEAEEVTFKSGNPGLKIKLLVDAGGDRDAWVWDNVVFTDKSLWKMKSLCEAIGVSFDPPPESFDLLNKIGSADFKVEEYNGRQNLKVDRYTTAESVGLELAPEAKADDVPF